MVYYHLALRYTRIFPGRFELVCDGWDPAGDGASPVATGDGRDGVCDRAGPRRGGVG